jgi:hypothetical protein
MVDLTSDTDDALAQLRAAFWQWRELQPNAFIYLLLDRNQPVFADHPLHPDSLAKRAVKSLQAPFARPDLEDQPDLQPLLLQLHGPAENGYPDEELLQLSLNCAIDRCKSVNGAYVAAWLCSNAPIDHIARHLSKSGVIFDLGQGRRRFMPIFEPHRFGLIVSDFSAHHYLHEWLGPISQWLWVDVNGKVRTHMARTAIIRETKGRPGLSRENLASMDRIGTARIVLMALEKSAITIPNSPESSIDNAIARASAAGLLHIEDLVFFALNCLTLSPYWADHPTSKRLIATTITDTEHRLAAAMSALQDSELDEIASSVGRSN